MVGLGSRETPLGILHLRRNVNIESTPPRSEPLRFNLSVCLSVCLFIYLSIYLFICLLSDHLSVCLSICLSPSLYLSLYLSLSLHQLSVTPAIFFLSFYLPICLSVCLSVCLYIYIYPCLFIFSNLSLHLSLCRTGKSSSSRPPSSLSLLSLAGGGQGSKRQHKARLRTSLFRNSRCGGGQRAPELDSGHCFVSER